jgi:hypothetical protein
VPRRPSSEVEQIGPAIYRVFVSATFDVASVQDEGDRRADRQADTEHDEGLFPTLVHDHKDVEADCRQPYKPQGSRFTHDPGRFGTVAPLGPFFDGGTTVAGP